jgi:hypothetical protein
MSFPKKISSTEDIQQIISVLREDGCVVLKGFLAQLQLSGLERDLDPEFAKIGRGVTTENGVYKDFYGNHTK